jgi:hypothetical protein
MHGYSLPFQHFSPPYAQYVPLTSMNAVAVADGSSTGLL